MSCIVVPLLVPISEIFRFQKVIVYTTVEWVEMVEISINPTNVATNHSSIQKHPDKDVNKIC